MDLEKRPWSSKSPPTKGPKRLCKFFVLAVILPMICLCVPLYMRFQALKPQIFTLSPLEELIYTEINSVNPKKINLKEDKGFKQGFIKQINSFLFQDGSNIPNIYESFELNKIISKICGYK